MTTRAATTKSQAMHEARKMRAATIRKMTSPRRSESLRLPRAGRTPS